MTPLQFLRSCERSGIVLAAKESPRPEVHYTALHGFRDEEQLSDFVTELARHTESGDLYILLLLRKLYHQFATRHEIPRSVQEQDWADLQAGDRNDWVRRARALQRQMRDEWVPE